jgi:hypothetical protein
MKSENRHYDEVHKKKMQPTAKCSKAKCIICHSGKVMNIPTKKILQENSKLLNERQTYS